MMTKIMRDLDTMPPFVADHLASDETTRVAALAGPFKARGAAARRVRAALAHALRLSTWQSLCADGGLTRDEAVRLMTATVRAAKAPPR
jgi:hypothetical protein